MAWSRCTACKRDIGFGAVYWQCSVSTCNRRNTDYTFCSVACWDSHIATLRHRDAWAVEARAPSREAWQREQDGGQKAPPAIAAPAPPARAPAPAPAPSTVPVSASAADAPRRLVATPPPAAPAQLTLAEAEADVLIVVSKMKKYIRDRSGMNTSDAVADALSAHVRAICDEAIRNAAADERKTVLDRDVPKPRR
jgi:hypothetical protein